jgi:Bacterial TniB protein
VANELKIVVVVVGTQDAFHALQTDTQVASRFEPSLIPRWTATNAFRAFIVAYGKLLPLLSFIFQNETFRPEASFP